MLKGATHENILVVDDNSAMNTISEPKCSRGDSMRSKEFKSLIRNVHISTSCQSGQVISTEIQEAGLK